MLSYQHFSFVPLTINFVAQGATLAAVAFIRSPTKGFPNASHYIGDAHEENQNGEKELHLSVFFGWSDVRNKR